MTQYLTRHRMAKGRELKGRIKSVENTRKITRTMEMVATSKMKRAQDRVMAARPYANALSEVISSLYSAELAERFPLLRQPARRQAGRGAPADVEPRPRGGVQLEPDQGSAQSDRAARRAGRRDRAARRRSQRASATSGTSAARSRARAPTSPTGRRSPMPRRSSTG